MPLYLVSFERPVIGQSLPSHVAFRVGFSGDAAIKLPLRSFEAKYDERLI